MPAVFFFPPFPSFPGSRIIPLPPGLVFASYGPATLPLAPLGPSPPYFSMARWNNDRLAFFYPCVQFTRLSSRLLSIFGTTKTFSLVFFFEENPRQQTLGSDRCAFSPFALARRACLTMVFLSLSPHMLFVNLPPRAPS